MNMIKGLLLKDLLNLRTYKKNLILSILIYVAIIVLNANNQDMVFLGTSMIVFLFSVYAMSTFSYDEKSNTDRYILTLPLNKHSVVLSKFLLLGLSIILGIIVGLLISFILLTVKVIGPIDYLEYFMSILGIILAISIIHCIQVPCIIKYGAEKGKLQIYIIMMVIFVIFGGIYFLFPRIDLSFLDSIELLLPYIIILLILFNYFMSYKISTKIIDKKEF